MIPNIKLSKYQESGSIIYLAYNIEDFFNIPFSEEEKKFIEKRFAEKKDIVTINKYSHQIFLVKLNNNDTGLVEENKRNAGNKLYKLLKKFTIDYLHHFPLEN